MKGDAKVIEFLNKCLKNELTAINQYFLAFAHAERLGCLETRRLRVQGIHRRNEPCRLADRAHFVSWAACQILQDLGKLRIGESVKEILECDLKLEEDAIPLLRDAMEYCESVRDYVSRELFGKILTNEEEHVDYIETQFELIDRIGIESYTHLQSEANAH